MSKDRIVQVRSAAALEQFQKLQKHFEHLPDSAPKNEENTTPHWWHFISNSEAEDFADALTDAGAYCEVNDKAIRVLGYWTPTVERLLPNFRTATPK